MRMPAEWADLLEALGFNPDTDLNSFYSFRFGSA